MLYFIRKIWGNSNRLKVSKSVKIGKHCLLSVKPPGSIVLDENVIIRDFVRLQAHGGTIYIGTGSVINEYCMLYGHGGLSIGKNVMIATHCVMIPANHIFTGNSWSIKGQGQTLKGIRIGDGSWIGANVTVLDGVDIGIGCVIGAGSVVTKSIPDLSVAFGNPCRVRKSRNA